MIHRLLGLALMAATLGAAASPDRDVNPVPARTEGRGPFPTLVIRGVTLIDGTGSPPLGPVDIVIKGNRITARTTMARRALP